MARKKMEPLKFSTNAIGIGGVRQYGGYISDEFVPDLRGTKAAVTYREMADNDPTVGAVLFAITMLLRSAEWKFQAVDEGTEADEYKTFAEEVLFHDMLNEWPAVIAEVCSMFTYGFAPMELVWKKRNGPNADPRLASAFDDGYIGLRTISLRAQATIVNWEIDDDGTILGVYQQPWDRGVVFIPWQKMLLFRTTEDRGNPMGRSVIRNAYRPWYFKKKIEEIEGIGVERDLAGLPVAFIPSRFFDANADPEDKRTLEEWKMLVTRVRRDQQEGLLLPSDRDGAGNPIYDFKLLSTGGSRVFDTTAIIDRYDRRIATSVLADFIFLGQQTVGSFALSSDKTALFATAIGAFMKLISGVINRQLMPRLWQLNGFPVDLMPLAVPGDIERQNLQEVGEFLAKLTQSGAALFPDRELENHLRQLAGFPPVPEEGEDLGRDVQPGEDGEGVEGVEGVEGEGNPPGKVVPMRKRKAARQFSLDIDFKRDAHGGITGARVEPQREGE